LRNNPPNLKFIATQPTLPRDLSLNTMNVPDCHDNLDGLGAASGLIKAAVFFYFLTTCVRPIISTSTEPIFTKFAGSVEL